MPQNPETRVKNNVNRKLTDVYNQSAYTAYSNGTPDHYYEGQLNALWVEWKHVKKLPAPSNRVQPLDPIELCSALQKSWIDRARSHTVAAWVIVGDDYGRFFVWFDDWHVVTDTTDTTDATGDAKEIADLIRAFTGPSRPRDYAARP